MPNKRLTQIAVPLAVTALIAAGCGSSSSNSSPSSTGGNGGSNGALSADAKSAATGDIPDNQNFLTFKDAAAGYSMRYPEGWAQSGSADKVSFQDKNNLVRVTVSKGSAPTVSSVASELQKLKSASPSLKAQAPKKVVLGAKPMVKVTYTTDSAPNPVTGKKVTLMVDRYELAKHGKVAVVELGTPTGVDNVDAYKMMIGSFKWL